MESLWVQVKTTFEMESLWVQEWPGRDKHHNQKPSLVPKLLFSLIQNCTSQLFDCTIHN